MARILVIDDDLDLLEAIPESLRRSGHDVGACSDGKSGIEELRRKQTEYDLVLTDLVMEEIDGLQVLDHVVTNCPQTKCVIITGNGTISSAVQAMKQGALDYVIKPVSSAELNVVVRKALEFKQLEEENTALKRKLRRKFSADRIVGTSNAIQRIYSMIEKVADTDSTVLISGASGTGKELIARAIHYESRRADAPLVVINCGAIPEELLESELFGHEKGAFTGAYKKRIGRFEMANGGTIFLDEVGEMSPALQVKLLRVLQEQKFERVGGTKTIHVDVRILAATNRNLTVDLNKGSFREDLYYRLNVIPIKIPSLKQRKSDIPLLIRHFLKKLRKGKDQIKGFSPEALQAMCDYHWPGNIRELENTIKRITVLSENEEIIIEDLPEHIQPGSMPAPQAAGEDSLVIEEGLALNRAVKEYEKRLILKALEKSDGVKTKAAEILKIKRTTLVEKMKKQDLDQRASG